MPAIASFGSLFAKRRLAGLRPTTQEEAEGLDISGKAKWCRQASYLA